MLSDITRYAEDDPVYCWLFQDGSQILVVWTGIPPTYKWYPDIETAKVAVALKGM